MRIARVKYREEDKDKANYFGIPLIVRIRRTFLEFVKYIKSCNMIILPAIILLLTLAIGSIPLILSMDSLKRRSDSDSSNADGVNHDSVISPLYINNDDNTVISFTSGVEYISASNYESDSGSKGNLSEVQNSQAYSAEYVSNEISLSDGGTGEYLVVGIEPSKSNVIMTNTATYFSARTSFLSQSLEGGLYYYTTVLLDSASGTSAYILARDSNYASNLNGYFYYLVDETASTSVVSPAVLNISCLFDEANREQCVSEGTFAESELISRLNESLKAFLGGYYLPEIYNFIYENYRNMFRERTNGEQLSIDAVKLVLPGIEIVYRNSFMTYIEFFITQ